MRAMLKEYAPTADTFTPLREAARLYADTHGFPDKKAEHWRYSAVRFAAGRNTPANSGGAACVSRLPELPGAYLPLSLSETRPAHIRLDPVDGAHALHIAESDNISCAHITASPDVPVSLTRGAEQRHHLYLHVAEDVRMTLIERILPGADTAYRSGFSEIVLEKGAQLTHYVIAETGGCVRYDSARITQRAESIYHGFTCVTGDSGSLKRDVYTELTEEGTENRQYLIHATGGDALVDHYLPVAHIAPRCKSLQHARYAVSDKATSVFYGRASAGKEAVGTEAHQLNKNILLSKGAKVYSRPELDILTNEIICSHGSATGGVDENALYYMQARGIPRQQAQAMLTAAFLQIDETAAPDAAIRDYVNALLQE